MTRGFHINQPCPDFERHLAVLEVMGRVIVCDLETTEGGGQLGKPITYRGISNGNGPSYVTRSNCPDSGFPLLTEEQAIAFLYGGGE